MGCSVSKPGVELGGLVDTPVKGPSEPDYAKIGPPALESHVDGGLKATSLKQHDDEEGTDGSSETPAGLSSQETCSGEGPNTKQDDMLPSSHVEGKIHAEGLEGRASHMEYKGAPLPPDEPERYQALCGLGEKLNDDVEPNENFDDITKLLCSIFHVPVAIVSLVAKDRQWFKSVQGLPVNSTERKASFCAWTLLPQHPEMLVVPDALDDIRFAENPLVQNDPYIRFYAGAPLIASSGHRLGSLCIIDRNPRELEAESCNVLINFAEIIVRELEKDQMRALETKKLERQKTGLLRAFDAFKESILVCDSSTPTMKVLVFNDAWGKVTGMKREDVLGRSLWDLFDIEQRDKVLAKAAESIAAMKMFDMEVSLTLQDRDTKLCFKASFRPGMSDSLDEHTPTVAIPGLMSTSKEDGVQGNLYFCTMQSIRRRSSSSGRLNAFRDASTKTAHQPFDDVQLGPMLGQGSYGKVFRGRWNGADVAVKILQPVASARRSSDGGEEPADSAKAIDRAAVECELTAGLAHPNVITAYKHAQIPLNYQIQLEGESRLALETWILLEYCNQGTLTYAIERGKFDEGFIKRGRRSNKPYLPSIRRTAEEIASALSYLHQRDILHGDLCGSNVLLCSARTDERGFTCKLADFGLARNLEEEAVTTSTYGTVTHMPPELLQTGWLSKAADSFAWGTILWEMFSGQRAWADMLPMQVIYQTTILNKCLEFPAATPADYRKLGEQCLDPDPKNRPSFEQILGALQEMQ